MKQIAIIHPTGNSNVRASLSALESAELLAQFYTTIAVNPSSKLLRILPEAVKKELLRRTFPITRDGIKTFPTREIFRMILQKLGSTKFIRLENDFASVDAIYRSLDQNLAKNLRKIRSHYNLGAVYAYEDGAFHTFKEAKSLGLKCIYELPIAYWETGRKLLEEETFRLPKWAATLGSGISDSEEKLERKTLELQLADIIISPGTFVTNSLPDFAIKKPVITAPFGSPAGNNSMKQKPKRTQSSTRPLRVLFAGSMGQRKGLGDLFEAIKLLDDQNIELVVMGSLLAPMKFYKNELNNFTYETVRPHEAVLELMRSCDVFCLPSIVEGRALVMQEAMSQGLPIIITPNTGGEDLVRDGSGFLIPIRSAEAIAEKLRWFLDNRMLIPEMGEAAERISREYTWENYGSTIVNFLRPYLQ